MLIIADKRIPAAARKKLSEYGEVVLFKTSGLTYEAISGHPDIFFCAVNGQLIVAPNLPENYKSILRNHQISCMEGEQPVGGKYPENAAYNVVSNDKYLFHNFRYTDSKINELADDLDLIHVNQGYCRCNLLPLKNDHYITSDEGIRRVLENYHFDVLYVDPKDILLPGMKHGFFGGCCGVWENKVFILGNLNHFGDGKKVRTYLQHLHYEIIELYDGPLFDGGSVLFIA
ncbi:MAG TPA: hypothetical protein PK904_06150 [Bacteroidales bacterium]|nr:hypothetical protein [Bacteroidales bacterium]